MSLYLNNFPSQHHSLIISWLKPVSHTPNPEKNKTCNHVPALRAPVSVHVLLTDGWHIKTGCATVDNAHIWSRATVSVSQKEKKVDWLWWRFAIFVVHKYFRSPVSAFESHSYLIRFSLSAGKRDLAFLMKVSLNIYLIKMKYRSLPEYKC